MGADLASCESVGCLRWEEIVLLQRNGKEEHTRKHPSCLCRKQTSLVLLFLEQFIIIFSHNWGNNPVEALGQLLCCAWWAQNQNGEKEQCSVTTALGAHAFGGAASCCILPNEIT